MNLLFQPGAPAYFVSLVGILVAVAGLRARQPSTAGLFPPATAWTARTRFLIGQIAGMIVVALVLAVFLQTTDGTISLLLATIGVAAYMYLGLVLPRKQQVAEQKRRKLLRRLTPKKFRARFERNFKRERAEKRQYDVHEVMIEENLKFGTVRAYK